MMERPDLEDPQVVKYQGREGVEYELDLLEEGDGITGVHILLPSSLDSLHHPHVNLYGREDFSGFNFTAKNEVYEHFFGIEGESERQFLEDETPHYKIKPFLNRPEYPDHGVRAFNFSAGPADYLVAANKCKDKEKDSLLIKAFRDNEIVKALNILRSEEDWTYVVKED